MTEQQIPEGGYSSFADFIRGEYSYDPTIHWVVKPKKPNKKALGSISEEDFKEFLKDERNNK